MILLAANIEENGTVSNSHMWIADGCKSFRVVNRIYTRENGQSIWKVLEEHEIAKEHLLHHWWGWGGYNDGWFNEAIMNFIPNENKQDGTGTFSIHRAFLASIHSCFPSIRVPYARGYHRPGHELLKCPSA